MISSSGGQQIPDLRLNRVRDDARRSPSGMLRIVRDSGMQRRHDPQIDGRNAKLGPVRVHQNFP